MADHIRWHRLVAYSDTVLGLLDRRKTETRRVIGGPLRDRPGTWLFVGEALDGAMLFDDSDAIGTGHDPSTCRVRIGPPYHIGDGIAWCEALVNLESYALYRATNQQVWWGGKSAGGPIGWRWKHNVLSARFMPNEAVRLFGEIVEVKPPQRVRDVSDADGRAEGLSGYWGEFAALWERLHGAGAWERNDWVWPIVFQPRDRAWAEARGFGRKR